MPTMSRQRPTITAKLMLSCVGLVLASLVVGAVAFAAASRTFTETRHRGSIEAVFSYRSKVPFGYEGQRLLVRRAGRPSLEAQLPADSSWPSPPGHSLALVDLDGGEPEVLLRLYTGGANCCFTWRVYRFAGGRYRGRLFNSGNAGLRLANLDRRGTPGRHAKPVSERTQIMFRGGVSLP